MNRVLGKAISVCTIALALITSVNAETIYRDVLIDVERDGRIIAFANQDVWQGRIAFPDTVLASGDTLIVKVRFANGKALRLSNPAVNQQNDGLEQTILTMLSTNPLSSEWTSLGAFTYLGVSGDLLSNPTNWGRILGSGNAFYATNSAFNLTNTSFTFPAVYLETSVESFTCTPGFVPCVFNEIEWNSSAEDVTIVDSPIRLVAIDIKPGPALNRVRPASNQKISVVVLSEGDFDALDIDVQSVEFGPAGATETHERAHVRDANGDGLMDLLLHFISQDTGIVCGDTLAMLTGETFSGQPISGTDSIVTVKCD